MTPSAPDCSDASNGRSTSGEDFQDVSILQEDDCASRVPEPCEAHPIRERCPGSELCEFRRGCKGLPFSVFPIEQAFSQGSQPERTGAVLRGRNPGLKVSLRKRRRQREPCVVARVIAIDGFRAKPPNRPSRVTIRSQSLAGKWMATIRASFVNPKHGIRVFYPHVSRVSRSQSSKPRLEGKNERDEVRFAEAIQTVVGSDPDISLAIFKNGTGVIVAQSILRGEGLDGGAELLDPTPEQVWCRRTPKPVAQSDDPQGSGVIKKNSRGANPDFSIAGTIGLIGSRDRSDGPRGFCHPEFSVWRLRDLRNLADSNTGRLEAPGAGRKKNQGVFSRDPKC